MLNPDVPFAAHSPAPRPQPSPKHDANEAFYQYQLPFTSAVVHTRSPVHCSGFPGFGGGGWLNPFALYAMGEAQVGDSSALVAKRACRDSESITPGEGKESNSLHEGGMGTEKTFGKWRFSNEANGGSDVWGEQATGGEWTEQECEYNFVVCMLERVT
jgi:hypothetical protein